MAKNKQAHKKKARYKNNQELSGVYQGQGGVSVKVVHPGREKILFTNIAYNCLSAVIIFKRLTYITIFKYSPDTVPLY